MKLFEIYWKKEDGLSSHESVVCEDFNDAVKRCRMQASLAYGQPDSVICKDDVKVLETEDE